MSILKEFPAYAGMITSDSGGRTVIDKFFGTSRRGNVDPVWDSGTSYSAGQYVWYPDKDGDIYRALESTSAGESPDTHASKWDSINAEWAGNDRPEKHQTLEGKYQACVEKEATNVSRGAQNPSATGDDITVTNVDINGLPGVEIKNDEGSTGTVANSEKLASYTLISSINLEVDDPATLSFFGKKTALGENRVGIRLFGDSFGDGRIERTYNADTGTIVSKDDSGYEILSEGLEVVGDLFYGWVSAKRLTSSHELTRFLIASDNEGGSIQVAGLDVIESAYPTLHIPTTTSTVTRPAPSPVIDNALPETGTVAGVVSTIYLRSNALFITSPISGSSTERSSVYFSSESELSFFVYGSSGGVNSLGFPFSTTDRVYISYKVSWDENNTIFCVMLPNGSIYKSTSSHQINDNSQRNVSLGRGSFRTSSHYEIPWYKDNIVRVNATDDEIKQFFENLTTGTSMATKKEDMTIV